MNKDGLTTEQFINGCLDNDPMRSAVEVKDEMDSFAAKYEVSLYEIADTYTRIYNQKITPIIGSKVVSISSKKLMSLLKLMHVSGTEVIY